MRVWWCRRCFKSEINPPRWCWCKSRKQLIFRVHLTVVLEGEDTISDVVVLESRDSREGFEERLAEIDKALARFDKRVA